MPELPIRVIDLEIEKIVIPAKRRRTYDKSDEKLQHFVDSIRKVGVLHPIEVREVGEGRYEPVFGFKRLWAAKQLGLTTIPARIATWTDEQIAFVGAVENTQRGHLSAPQYVKQFQLLLREFEHLFGPDLGHKACGLATARKAKRDPETKQFTQSDGNGPESAENLDEEPVTEAGSVTGQEEAEPRSHATMIGEAISKTDRSVRDDIHIARAFTEEELDELDQCDHVPNKAELLEVAKIEDQESRSQCVRLVCTGMSVAEALKLNASLVNDPDNARLKKQVAEDELPDEQWLGSYCAEPRSRLQDPTIFDREALLYRHDRKERHAHRARSKDLVLKVRRKGYGPFSHLLANIFWVTHPGEWLMCHSCAGQNRDQPACKGCNGCGFKIIFKHPEKNGR